jgi:hypothetical protein
MLSIGTSWAQLDAGYREHWLSPMTDTGSMLFSTESPTSPSVTLSNWEPLTRLGFQYEFILSRLSQTSANSGRSLPGANIDYNGTLSRGDPHLFSMQLSIEPFPGWSLGFNRNLEYGGGSGLPDSARFLLRDFFNRVGRRRTRETSKPPTSVASFFPARRPLPSISSTRARTTPTAAATSSGMPHSRPASIFRASGATSMRPMRSPSGRTSGMCISFSRTA